MKESITTAIVLHNTSFGEFDFNTHLFTREFGKIEARVVGGNKILSKFSQHLDPINLVIVRLVAKNLITLTDVLVEDRFGKIRADSNLYGKSLKILKIIGGLTPEEIPDKQLWHYMVDSFKKGKPNIETILKIIGYGTSYSMCRVCGSRKTMKFSKKSQVFLCEKCSGKFPSDDVVYIG